MLQIIKKVNDAFFMIFDRMEALRQRNTGAEVFLIDRKFDGTQYYQTTDDVTKIIRHKGDFGVKISRRELIDSEYEAISKIAGLSGMACWFTLVAKENNPREFVVYDLEDDRTMSLRSGLKLLKEGMTSVKDYNLTPREAADLDILYQRMGLEF